MIKTKLQEMDGYLLVTVSGDYDISFMKDRMPELAALARKSNNTRIFVDAMGIVPPKDDMKRFLMGEALAAMMKPPLRIAILSPAEMINRFLENTAVNRGVLIFVTYDKEEAMRWLFPNKGKTVLSSST